MIAKDRYELARGYAKGKMRSGVERAGAIELAALSYGLSDNARRKLERELRGWQPEPGAGVPRRRR